jgi:AraC-like DNA-binding protein
MAGETFDIVHARLLRFFPELVESLGGDAAALLRQAGIDDSGETTYRHAVALLELAARALDCPDFGLRLAARQRGAIFGPLGLAMKNSRTFGDALVYTRDHTFAHSLAARIWHERRGDMLFAGHDILLDRLPSRSQAMEHILLAGHLSAIEITGGMARVRRVHFRHQPLSPLSIYRRHFGCEVRFGQDEDGVLFADRDLACRIVDPDKGAYRAVTSFIDAEFTRHQPPIHAQARGAMMRLLASGGSTNARVAAELGLHLRTLHRRLKTEGTSFQRLKDEVRREALLYYVQQTGLDFARISERLGFAEQSVMTRSCNRWFGMSPTRLRAQGLG